MPSLPTALKLHALDREGLDVLSAHMQDACARRENMKWIPGRNRFVLGSLRYDWAAAKHGVDERVGSVLRFDRVLRVSHVGMNNREDSGVLNLLGMTFERTEPPSGMVFLSFADGAIVRLEVECLEAELRDVGPRAQACDCVGHTLTIAEATE
jgi:hypothetical protein